MKIRAIRGNYGDNGYVRRGQIIDVAPKKAEDLKKRKLFVDVEPAKKPAAVKGKA